MSEVYAKWRIIAKSSIFAWKLLAGILVLLPGDRGFDPGQTLLKDRNFFFFRIKAVHVKLDRLDLHKDLV